MAKFRKPAAAADPLKPYAPVADPAMTDTPPATAAATDSPDPAKDAGAVQAGAGGAEQSPQVAAPPAPATPAPEAAAKAAVELPPAAPLFGVVLLSPVIHDGLAYGIGAELQVYEGPMNRLIADGSARAIG